MRIFAETPNIWSQSLPFLSHEEIILYNMGLVHICSDVQNQVVTLKEEVATSDSAITPIESISAKIDLRAPLIPAASIFRSEESTENTRAAQNKGDKKGSKMQGCRCLIL